MRFLGQALLRRLRSLGNVPRIPDLRARRIPGQILRCGLAVRTGARRPRDGVIEYATGKVVTNRPGAAFHDRGQRQLLAGQREVLQFRPPSADGKCSLQLLKILVESELEVLRLAVALKLPAPPACSDAWYHPVEHFAPLPYPDRLPGRGHLE